jgi:hypothetical protein
MDTPTVPPPHDEEEKKILENLVSIRDQLLLRKSDRATYVRTQEVMILYDKTIEQVRQLTEVRKGKKTGENRGENLQSHFVLHLSALANKIPSRQSGR